MGISDWSSDVCSSELAACTWNPSNGRCTWSRTGGRPGCPVRRLPTRSRPEYARTCPLKKEMAMRSVRQLLEAKAPEVFAIGPDEPVVDAIRLMAETCIGALLVMQAGKLVGIVSEQLGRVHVLTPVTNAHIVCSHMLERNN